MAEYLVTSEGTSILHREGTNHAAYIGLVRDMITGASGAAYTRVGMSTDGSMKITHEGAPQPLHPSYWLGGGGGCTHTHNTENEKKKNWVPLNSGFVPHNTGNKGPRDVPATADGSSVVGSDGRGCGSSKKCPDGVCPLPTRTRTTTTTESRTATAPSDASSDSMMDTAVCIFGPEVSTKQIVRALRAGHNNFGISLPGCKMLNIEQTDNMDKLRGSILRGMSTIIAFGKDCNKLLRVCREVGYNGTLILIGGATRDVIEIPDDVFAIPSTVRGVVLTHGAIDADIIDQDTYDNIVGRVPCWLYVGTADTYDLPLSLLDVNKKNRSYSKPYLLELVRALRISVRDGLEHIDWRQVLTNTFVKDRRHVDVEVELA